MNLKAIHYEKNVLRGALFVSVCLIIGQDPLSPPWFLFHQAKPPSHIKKIKYKQQNTQMAPPSTEKLQNKRATSITVQHGPLAQLLPKISTDPPPPPLLFFFASLPLPHLEDGKGLREKRPPQIHTQPLFSSPSFCTTHLFHFHLNPSQALPHGSLSKCHHNLLFILLTPPLSKPHFPFFLSVLLSLQMFDLSLLWATMRYAHVHNCGAKFCGQFRGLHW